MTIDSNTVISNSYVSSIRFKGQNYSTSGARVAQFLYVGNVIEWNSTHNSKVEFKFDALPLHTKLIVRVRAYAECNSNLKIDFPLTNKSKIQNISPFKQTVVQTEILDTSSSSSITLLFEGQMCRKLVQDISIYYD